jgi:integrase/recombinase XerD
MKRITYTDYARECIAKLEKEARYSTAHLYANSLRSFTEYLNKPMVKFRDFSREKLINYQQWLFGRHKSSNTVSTYMRMLRSIYNKGVDAGHADHVLRLFHDVYTGIDTTHKKSLPLSELHALLYKDPGTDVLRRTQFAARLQYQLCGIPFVDLAHVRPCDIVDGVLVYHRIKTGVKVCVKILEPVIDTVNRLYSLPCYKKEKNNSYALDILSDMSLEKTFSSYCEYQSALRGFNSRLGLLAKHLGLRSHISSYTLRHSWATTAKNVGASVEKISELLGHKSIKTTQIYLSSFSIGELAKVNRKACKCVENAK